MPLCLEHAPFTLSLHPERACWSLALAGSPPLVLPAARFQVVVGQGGRARALFDDAWPGFSLAGEGEVRTPLGPLPGLRVAFGGAAEGLAVTLTFALSAREPALLWQAELRNTGAAALPIDAIDLLAPAALEWPGASPEGWSAYCNGWQSWSHSGAYPAGRRPPRTRLGSLQAPMVLNPAAPPARAGQYPSEWFGVLAERRQRRAVLLGCLSQRQHFATAVLDLRPALALRAAGDGAVLPPGAAVETDWAALLPLDLDAPEPLAPYLDAVAAAHGRDEPAPVPVGWCSWYHYYTAVTAADVRANLAAAQGLAPRLPLDLIQLDDGYETQLGDWQSFKPAFPGGVAPLAAEIRAAGRTPGLWMAPFIVHPRSRLAAVRPEWLLRGRNGRPVRAGFVWNALNYGLDLTAPGALDQAAEWVRAAVHDWGFAYLKLDFLYAAALPGRFHDRTLTRAQVLRRGLEALRQAAGPEATLLGCGVPLGPAVGLFQAMRISADVSGDWHPHWNGIQLLFHAEPHMPSARNAVQNILARLPLHGRLWVNDPDCLPVRPGTRLTLDEVRSLATAISLSAGSLLLSDDLAALPEERLRLAERLIPPLPRAARAVDWLDEPTPRRLRLDLDGPSGPWSLLACFNWSDLPAPGTLRLAEYGLDAGRPWLAHEFWTGAVLASRDGAFDLGALPPNGVRLLAARPRPPEGQPLYLGSDLHISQGLELAGWQPAPGRVRLRLALPRAAQGEIVVRLPAAPRNHPARPLGLPGVWAVGVEVDGERELELARGEEENRE